MIMHKHLIEWFNYYGVKGGGGEVNILDFKGKKSCFKKHFA